MNGTCVLLLVLLTQVSYRSTGIHWLFWKIPLGFNRSQQTLHPSLFTKYTMRPSSKDAPQLQVEPVIILLFLAFFFLQSSNFLPNNLPWLPFPKSLEGMDPLRHCETEWKWFQWMVSDHLRAEGAVEVARQNPGGYLVSISSENF